MDDELRKRFASRRNKRYAHLRGFNEEAKLADTLDWKNNDNDYHRLTRSILNHLDSVYREKWGVRVDQLATAQEIQEVLDIFRTWYQKDEQLFVAGGIYVFLHLNLHLWLGGKACEVLDKRRELAGCDKA